MTKRIYQHTWFIILILFVAAPIGIWLLWRQKCTWKIATKLTASILAAFFFISVISSSAVPDTFVKAKVRTTQGDTATAVASSDTVIFATTTIQPTSGVLALLNSQAADSTSSMASDSEMKVHFLDVGQGAATLIQIDSHTMLIDGGDRETSSFVVAYLKKQGISKIDVMIATHYDSDHINGLVGALNVFSVKQVYDCNYTVNTRVFNSFKSFIKDNAIPESAPAMTQTIQLGEAMVTFVAPRQYGHAEENDDSICVRVQFGKTSFLIMGDPSADAEQQILSQNLKSDVFCASHHGSNGSNSKTLLANVAPEFVVISCGLGNPYGHPGDNTLARIKSTGAGLYRTDKQGTIICTSDGSRITWDKPPCNDFSPGVTTIQPTTSIPMPMSSSAPYQVYVLNTNTKKFHYPTCSSVPKISAVNREDVTLSRTEIISKGYAPCGICHP